MAHRWSHLLGDHPQRESIESTLAHSLAGTTVDNYGGHWARFVRWCEKQPDQPCPLPASTGTVLRWLAGDVCASGEGTWKVRASSLQPYLSALNRIHRDLELDEPALGYLVQQYRRGLAHQQGALGRSSRRVYLPPPVVERVLEWALALDVSRASRAELTKFRAAVATVFTFCFFARGATGGPLLCGHVRSSATNGILVTLEHEKGKAANWDSRVFTFPPESISGFEALLQKWEQFRDVRGTRARAPTDSYYLLPWESRKTFPSTQIDTWLKEILSHLGVAPPDGEQWSGHSLRKGAASGAAAIGAPLNRICWCGGWSQTSRAVHDYIDPTCPASTAARRFFGWLRPPS